MRIFKLTTTVYLVFFLFANCFGQHQLSLFNGKDLKMWKQVGNSFSATNSSIVSQGKEGYAFFEGENATFKNYEFSCKARTEADGVADLLLCTKALSGKEVPSGYAIRIKNTYEGTGSGDGLRLTGSIDRIRNVYFPFVKDNEWFDIRVSVNEKRLRVYINNVQVNDYKEPSTPWRPADLKNRFISTGTVGLHQVKGKVEFKDLNLVEKPAETSQITVDPEYDKMVTQLHAQNFPFVDFHVHLKGGLTIADVVANAQRLGMNYGVAANCGLRFPVTNNRELNDYLNSIQNAPVFKGMQAEGREWMTLFSPDTAARFDYIFTDAMTWTNKNGMRMRLWIKEETEVGDPEKFMEELVSKIEQIAQEPIDIYVNPSYIPDEIAPRYNELWTNERMDRVIKALVKNRVALEINSRYKLPGIEFIRKAKAAGVKFTFGTNNTGPGDLDYSYCIKVLKEVGLTPEDMWMPRKPGERKIQKQLK